MHTFCSKWEWIQVPLMAFMPLEWLHISCCWSEVIWWKLHQKTALPYALVFISAPCISCSDALYAQRSRAPNSTLKSWSIGIKHQTLSHLSDHAGLQLAFLVNDCNDHKDLNGSQILIPWRFGEIWDLGTFHMSMIKRLCNVSSYLWIASGND